jgi:murein DD-endopeptidase MepM/ murein hydrolase activator NlpD
MLAGSLLLGGLLPLSPNARANWAPSGAWRLPVGDPYELSVERPHSPGPFFLLRSVEWDGGRATHQGADIGCGASGGFVRAAAAGIVVHIADHGENGGYGTNVVLAHRLPGGVLAYSVYAHLRTASIRVRSGRFVPAGTILGRVGMTGRATTPHLHFEVRTTSDPGERWELANVEDPLAFIDERLPSHRGDTSGGAAYLEWAEFTSMLPTGAQGDDVLSRARWWRMLSVTGRGTLVDPDLPAGELRDTLVVAGLLPKTASARGEGDAMDWPELANDLNRLRHTNLRGGTAPLRRAPHREVCAAQFGTPTPTKRTSELSGRASRPSLTDAVLLLADLVGPRPEPPKKAAPKPAPARTDSVARAKAKPASGKSDSSAVLKPAPAKVVSAKPAKSPSSKADSTKKAKAPAAKPDSTKKAKPSTAKADSATSAKKPPVKASSATPPKSTPGKPDTAAKPKRPPGTAPAHAPSRPDTASS